MGGMRQMRGMREMRHGRDDGREEACCDLQMPSEKVLRAFSEGVPNLGGRKSFGELGIQTVFTNSW